MFIAQLTDAQAKALEAVLSERAYQDAQQGNAKRHEGFEPRVLHPAEYILYMEKCLNDAREAVYRGGTGAVDCLPYVRKIGALAMACMEAHGAPLRELPNGKIAAPPAKKPFGRKFEDDDGEC